MLGRSLRITSVLLLLVLTAAAETIPYGTRITVLTSSQINSATAKSGDRFQANLASDLVVNGKTLAKTGAPAKGRVTFAKSSGRLHNPGQLSLRLTAVEIDGKMVPVSTSAFRAKGKSHTKSNAIKIGGGTAAGAVLGGVVGGPKGMLIGAAAGGAAGTGLAAATGKQEAVIHAETAATFTMTKSAMVK